MSPLKANSSFKNVIKTPIKLFNKSGPLKNFHLKKLIEIYLQHQKLLSLFQVNLYIFCNDEEYNLCEMEFV